MKFLVIGLGSMGKRRIRNLQRLEVEEIIGFDPRQDRRQEAEGKYYVKTCRDFNEALTQNPDAFIISTPPDKHNQYIKLAIEHKKPAFVEASVILEGLGELNSLAKKQKILIAPSCTFRFHPAILDIKNIARSGQYGKLTNLICHSGQYLPDWHMWEDVKDFYVSQKETGGCREIVPFELTWIVDIAGFPKNVTGFYGKTMDVGADIDDTYVVAMDFGDAYGSLTVDVVSRYASRSLILNMEYAQILWRWDENIVKLYDARNQKWVHHQFQKGEAAEGYDRNIIEEMYIDEMKSFIEALEGRGRFPNSLNDDIKILKLLQRIETKR